MLIIDHVMYLCFQAESFGQPSRSPHEQQPSTSRNQLPQQQFQQLLQQQQELLQEIQRQQLQAQQEQEQQIQPPNQQEQHIQPQHQQEQQQQIQELEQDDDEFDDLDENGQPIEDEQLFRPTQRFRSRATVSCKKLFNSLIDKMILFVSIYKISFQLINIAKGVLCKNTIKEKAEEKAESSFHLGCLILPGVFKKRVLLRGTIGGRTYKGYWVNNKEKRTYFNTLKLDPKGMDAVEGKYCRNKKKKKYNFISYVNLIY